MACQIKPLLNCFCYEKLDVSQGWQDQAKFCQLVSHLAALLLKINKTYDRFIQKHTYMQLYMNSCGMSNCICLCAGLYHSVSLKSDGVGIYFNQKMLWQIQSNLMIGTLMIQISVYIFVLCQNKLACAKVVFAFCKSKSKGEVSQVQIKTIKMAFRLLRLQIQFFQM